MKKLLFYLLPFLLVISSCTTNHVHIVNHGKPKGHYKNSHNPHHPMTTNPGHTKKRGGVIVVAPSNAKVVVVPAGNGKHGGKGKKKK